MKKLKYLMLALVVSFAFVLSACGEGQLGVKAQANIGNKANYTEATAADKEAFVAIVNNAEATGVTAYRMTMDLTTESMLGGESKMSFNCIYAVSEDSYEMAIKAEVSEAGEKASFKIYVKDGNVYMEFTGGAEADAMKELFGSNKIKLPLDDDMAESMLMMVEILNLEQLLGMVKEMDLEEVGVAVKVNTEGTTTRYAIEQEDMGAMYFVFEEGRLTAIQAEMVLAEMGDADVTVVIEEFTGAIEYPDFNSFVDYSMEF